MEKRQPKPRYVFSPVVHVRKTRLPKVGLKPVGNSIDKRERRSRNIVADENCHNKWSIYQQRILKLLSVLRTQSHFFDVMTQQKRERPAVSSSVDGEVSEVTRCFRKIGAAKCSIIALFQEIAAENKDDKVFPQLAADADESGLIDVDEVVCSLCGTDDVEGNDVLLCDHAGCCRAYHQNCLSPAIIIPDDNDEDADWFCWQCECIDDCLDLVNEKCETEVCAWEDLFPELREVSEAQGGNEISEESDDDEEDDDYDPDIEHTENIDNDNNSDVGYDTDELSYDGIEVDDSADPKPYDSDAESEDGPIELERDEDLECDIDSEEVGQLLSEAGSGRAESLLDSVTVAGRQLRVRTMKEIKSDPAFTVEGSADVGKDVVKVKRGFVVTGKVTAYYPTPTDTSDTQPTSVPISDTSGHRESTADSSSSSSSSSSGLDNNSNSGSDVIDKQEEEREYSVPAAVEVSDAILNAAMYADGIDIVNPLVAEIPDKVQDPLIAEILEIVQDPILKSETDHFIIAQERQEDGENNVTKDMKSIEAPIVHTVVPTSSQVIENVAASVECAAQAVRAIPGVWHVLYEDGSEGTLDYAELSKGLLDAKEHFKFLKKAQRASAALEQEQLVKSKGALDVGNVLQHKRSRKQIDYVSLSLQMFGTVVDDDPEADGDLVDIEDLDNENDDQSKKKRKKKMKEESSGKKGQEAPFVFDHVLFLASPGTKMESPKP